MIHEEWKIFSSFTIHASWRQSYQEIILVDMQKDTIEAKLISELVYQFDETYLITTHPKHKEVFDL